MLPEVLVKLTLYAPCSIARGAHSVKAPLENVAQSFTVWNSTCRSYCGFYSASLNQVKM